MSLLKANSVQIGQSTTGTNNFTLSVPSSPDGTIKLARGNSGATTQDILTVNSSGAVTLTNGGAITLGAAQASTSGTAIDFTGIPSWAKKITVMFDGVSTNGASTVQIQIGSTTFSTSGYSSSASVISGASASSGTSSTGYLISAGGASGDARNGLIIIANITSNTWILSGSIGYTGAAATGIFSGSLALGGVLDRLRVTTVNGTDTFDAGSVNIMYEG
jgi:hypothetical protein